MSRTRTRPVFETGLSESADKIVLFGAFLIGIVGLLVIKGLYEDILMSAIFAGAVLVVYVVLAWTLSRQEIEPEVIGDNVYYLGFLFTLTSLAMTLYGLAEAGASEDLMKTIVAGFGIALSSTIVGVFLRVLMTQFRVDLVARDRATRIALNRSVREMRSELSVGAAEMKRFCIELTQTTREANDRILKDAETGYRDMVESGRDAADAYARILLETVSGSTDDLMARIRSDLSTSLGSFTQEAEAATERLHAAMAAYENSVQQHGAQMGEQRTRIATDVAAAQKDAEAVYAGIRDLATDLPAQTEALGASLTASASALFKVTEGVSADLAHAVSDRTRRLSDIAAMRGKADQARDDLEATITTLRTATERLHGDAANVRLHAQGAVSA